MFRKTVPWILSLVIFIVGALPVAAQGPVEPVKPVLRIWAGVEVDAATTTISCKQVTGHQVVPTQAVAVTEFGDYPVFLPVTSAQNCPVIKPGSVFLSGGDKSSEIGPQAKPSQILSFDLPTSLLSYALSPTVSAKTWETIGITGTIPVGNASYRPLGVWRVTSFGAKSVPATFTASGLHQDVPMPSELGNLEGYQMSILDERHFDILGFPIKPDTELAPSPDKLQLKRFGELCPEQAQKDALYLGSFPIVKGGVQEWWTLINWGRGENAPCSTALRYVFITGATTMLLLPDNVRAEIEAAALVRAKSYTGEIEVQMDEGPSVPGDIELEIIETGGFVLVAIVVVVVVGSVVFQQYYLIPMLAL